ncbi:hypothetical protein [Paenibacillus sp. XY044]|uniref:hypothetical protein n=1 Tax=Paenibacillus sp. XY044 TaxID=2026089 RepID=UPI000B984568|nr:hypothetical protein [Paenibacillus sp. XY044]OZB92240.1 hypothetical protein CJP46_25220 [Paenibacillus sp. XY044]
MATFIKTIKGVTKFCGNTSIQSKNFGKLHLRVVLVSKVAANEIEAVTILKMGNKNLATIRTKIINGNVVRQKAAFGKGFLPGIRNLMLKQTRRNNKTVISGLINGERIKAFTPGCKCKRCSCGSKSIQLQNGTKLNFTINKKLDCALKRLFAKFNLEMAAAIKKFGTSNPTCLEECNKIARKCNDDCFFDSVCAPACEAARAVCVITRCL